jgi:hypothetical protein
MESILDEVKTISSDSSNSVEQIAQASNSVAETIQRKQQYDQEMDENLKLLIGDITTV